MTVITVRAKSQGVGYPGPQALEVVQVLEVSGAIRIKENGTLWQLEGDDDGGWILSLVAGQEVHIDSRRGPNW